MFLQIVALLIAVAADEPAWRVEITTSGGFVGHGAGGLVITPDGKLVLRRGCELAMTADDLKTIGELVAKARPEQWKPSYVQPTNPEGCCDMIRTTLTVTRGGKRWTSTWFDDHGVMPADLDAIVSAVWSTPKSIGSRYRTQCKP